MKKIFLVSMIALLVIAAVGLMGCGDGKGDGSDDRGTASSAQGSVTQSGKTPTESELGMPLYPNATAVENASATYSEGGRTYAAAQFVTTDPVTTVLEWYRGKLSGKPGFRDMSSPQGGIIVFQDGNIIRSVGVGPGSGDQQGKTVIAIQSGTGTILQTNP